ncbi:MAG: hypothetical protein LBQ54_02225 [Planctomycetaceae bacterium]|jgi:hypothetical protein|nr:hypothetical protein [Planctomycetaceae bacterium]
MTFLPMPGIAGQTPSDEWQDMPDLAGQTPSDEWQDMPGIDGYVIVRPYYKDMFYLHGSYVYSRKESNLNIWNTGVVQDAVNT